MVQVSVEMFQLHMATAFHFFISNMAFGFVYAGMPHFTPRSCKLFMMNRPTVSN